MKTDGANGFTYADLTIEGNALKSTGQDAGKILETDGSGGFSYIFTPTGLGSKVLVVAE